MTRHTNDGWNSHPNWCLNDSMNNHRHRSWSQLSNNVEFQQCNFTVNIVKNVTFVENLKVDDSDNSLTDNLTCNASDANYRSWSWSSSYYPFNGNCTSFAWYTRDHPELLLGEYQVGQLLCSGVVNAIYKRQFELTSCSRGIQANQMIMDVTVHSCCTSK